MKTLTDFIWSDKINSENIEQGDPGPVLELSCGGSMRICCSPPPPKKFS